MTRDDYSTILVSGTGGVIEIALNRPEVRNAFDETLIAELTSAVNGASDIRCRALILRGAGPAFCAGADLNWMARSAGFSHDENLKDARRLQRMFAAIAHFPGVTIALVHGAAIGGGAGLAAVCDVTIALDATVFALSEVRLGLVPAVIAPYVIEKIGPGAARALFVTGERFDAAKASRIGLVQHTVADDRQRDALLADTLKRILEAGPHAIDTAKRLIRQVAGKNPDDAAEITAECIATLRVGTEGQEGLRAFLDKRPPAFVETLPEATLSAVVAQQ